MATRFNTGLPTIEAKPKKTYQGRGKHTKYSATSANKPKKRYRGQGKYCTKHYLSAYTSKIALSQDRVFLLKKI